MSFRDIDNPPESVCAMFRVWLIHFLDPALPKLAPVHLPSTSSGPSLLSCHSIRCWLTEQEMQETPVCPVVQMKFHYASHSGIMPVAVHWKDNKLLLFSGERLIERSQAFDSRYKQALETPIGTGSAVLLSSWRRPISGSLSNLNAYSLHPRSKRKPAGTSLVERRTTQEV